MDQRDGRDRPATSGGTGPDPGAHRARRGAGQCRGFRDRAWGGAGRMTDGDRGEGVAGAGALFVGVGVTEYDNGHPRLPRAFSDVEAVAGLLAGAGWYARELLRNPTEEQARALMRRLANSMPEGGNLVVLWSGQGFKDGGGDDLVLLARDSPPGEITGLAATSDVVKPCAGSGANQILLIFDTCYSGSAMAAGNAAARILEKVVPKG